MRTRTIGSRNCPSVTSSTWRGRIRLSRSSISSARMNRDSARWVRRITGRVFMRTARTRPVDSTRKETTPESAGLTLEKIVEHIDHVCQIAGSARHSGIGSDLDGAFGREQTPADLDTIADLARIPTMIKARGYSEENVTLIAHGNFVRFLTEAWS